MPFYLLHYINTFKQEIGSTKDYELQISADKMSVVNDHCCHRTTKFAVSVKKKLIEKFRECHNHKPQPTPTRRGREKLQKNQHVQNKQTNAREAQRPPPSSPIEVITMLKGMTKHENKEHEKTLKHEAPRNINHKAIQNKNDTGTTA